MPTFKHTIDNLIKHTMDSVDPIDTKVHRFLRMFCIVTEEGYKNSDTSYEQTFDGIQIKIVRMIGPIETSVRSNSEVVHDLRKTF